MNAIDPNVVTQYEVDTWSRCAKSYLDTFAVLTRESVPLLIQTSNIRHGDKVLDVGSGPGHVAKALSDVGAAVRGVDFSEEMVAVAAERFPTLTFEYANAEKLPFEDNTFDAAIANFVVHHLARPAAVFREISRVLKPAKRFAFVVWGAPEEQSSIAAFFGAVMAHREVDELPHGPLFGVTDKAAYETLFEASGFGNLQLSEHRLDWACDSLDTIISAYWDWADMHALPRNLQVQIEQATRDNAALYRHGSGYVFPHSVVLGVTTNQKS